jgi:hypothetical protein
MDYSRDVYLFHQTPEALCKELIKYVPCQDGDILLEPFKGEGNFYRNFPTTTVNEWCEIKEDRDYKHYKGKIDWVITNPPFCLDEGGKRVNAFIKLLFYFTERTDKGVCFLANYKCWSSLTPIRLKALQDKGWYLQKAVVCNIKKWSGRYYWLIFTKQPNDIFPYILGSF